MKYRADIDGLRSLAIIPVVLFHAEFISGGYVGVDVFFVISGYLITQIIYSEIESGNFSIIYFYDRRIKRIIPALFFMMAVVTVVGAVLLAPPDFLAYGRSLVATTLFMSNIYFWKSIDYFSDLESPFPLLHTWSLAVEEQFYIFFPIILFLLMKIFRVRLVFWALVAVAVVSLLLAGWGAFEVPRLTFYMLPTRAWELLAGSLIALPVLRPFPTPVARLAALAGVVLVIVPMVVYTPQTPFPGWTALPPVLGAALIIHAGRSSAGGLVERALSIRPLVYIGKQSYSLYLWHWPVFVFAHLYFDDGISPALAVGLIVLSVLLAAFSLRFVETPFRKGTVLPRMPVRFAATAAVMALSVGIGQAIVQARGFDGRMSPLARDIIAMSGGNPLQKSCLISVGFSLNNAVRLPSAERCILESGPSSKPYHAVLWGDSHADALAPGLRSYLGQDVPMRQITQEGCPPLVGAVGVSERQRSRGSRCLAFNDAVLKELARLKDVTTVYLSGRWSAWVRPDDPEWKLGYLVDDQSDELSAENSRRAFKDALSRTIRDLQALGKRVVIFGGVPEFPHAVSNCMMRRDFLGGDPLPCSTVAMRSYEGKVRPSVEVLREVEKEYPGTTVVLMGELVCDDARCSAFDGQKLYFRDYHHLSAFGGRELLGRLPKGAIPAPATP